MTFQLNGEAQTAQEAPTVLNLLERFDLRERRVAVAINARIVSKSRFAEVKIRDGDRVEVIQAVGGG